MSDPSIPPPDVQGKLYLEHSELPFGPSHLDPLEYALDIEFFSLDPCGKFPAHFLRQFFRDRQPQSAGGLASRFICLLETVNYP